MKLLPGVILLALTLSGATVASNRVPSAGSKYFDAADRTLRDGEPADSAASAEKGWAAVLAAGPVALGFLEGVDDAVRIFYALGLVLRAEGAYTQAETLTAAGPQLLLLRVQYIHAHHLIQHSEYVQAESILRSSLSAENRTAQKSSLYVAFLQSLAFLREQQGDLDGAEAFYRMTIGYPPSDLPDVVRQHFVFGKQLLPFIGEPRLSMAAFYTNHGRIKEAEALYREQLAQPSVTGEERLGILQQLVSFLSAHVSKTEALAVEQQIVELRKAQPLTTPQLRDLLANERYQLANLEVDVGRGDDAKALLESDLRQAELRQGKSGPEYTEALNYLFENRRYAQDYDSAEKLAREEVERAEAPGASERIGLASALFRVAEVRQAQGHIEESDALRKRGIELNRADFPEPESTRQFACAEALVRAGKPGEAVRIAREISAGAARRNSRTDQFGFRHLAQLMASDDRPDAAQVASFALSAAERGALPYDLSLARDLTDWANFYRGFLGQPDRAGDLLTRAETIVRTCCGTASRMMEPVLQERAWLAGATNGQAASIPYLEQLRDLRSSIYGLHSRQVEQTIRDLEEAKAKAGQ